MALVARALLYVLYSSDLSNSELALKAEFADKHLLWGPLFSTLYLLYHKLGTAWHLLFCQWSGNTHRVIWLGLSVSPYLAKTLWPCFCISIINKMLWKDLENLSDFESSQREEGGLHSWPSLHISWWAEGVYHSLTLLPSIGLLSRDLLQPGPLILLVLSIFILLYICKVLSSDLLAVLGFNSPLR